MMKIYRLTTYLTSDVSVQGGCVSHMNAFIRMLYTSQLQPHSHLFQPQTTYQSIPVQLCLGLHHTCDTTTHQCCPLCLYVLPA